MKRSDDNQIAYRDQGDTMTAEKAETDQDKMKCNTFILIYLFLFIQGSFFS